MTQREVDEMFTIYPRCSLCLSRREDGQGFPFLFRDFFDEGRDFKGFCCYDCSQIDEEEQFNIMLQSRQNEQIRRKKE